MTVLYTSATVLTALYLTSRDCTPTQKHLSNCSVTSSPLTTLPSLPAPKEPSSTQLPALQRLPNSSYWRSPTSAPSRVPPSPHHHRLNWAENSSSIYLSGVYHHIRRQDRLGSRQQLGQGKQRFRQTLQKTMEQRASEEGH